MHILKGAERSDGSSFYGIVPQKIRILRLEELDLKIINNKKDLKQRLLDFAVSEGKKLIKALIKYAPFVLPFKSPLWHLKALFYLQNLCVLAKDSYFLYLLNLILFFC